MPRLRTEATGLEIRRVALELFVTQGYDATSIRDIAARVGIRGASMYHHFASKEAILWDLTRSALSSLAESWRTAEAGMNTRDPASLLRAFVRVDAVFHAEHHSAAMLVNAQLHRLSPENYSTAVALRHKYECELVSIVEDCVATGRFQVPDVRVTTFAILQMTAAIANWYRPDGPLSIPDLAAIYEELALKMLAAPPSR